MTIEASHSMTINSDIQNIRHIDLLVDSIMERHHINPELHGRVLIALTEATNNAILHGNGNDPTKCVTIIYKVETDRLEFSIMDEGRGFDYNHLPDPTDPERIHLPNGRGVFLMRELSDALDFENNGSLVKLCFNLACE